MAAPVLVKVTRDGRKVEVIDGWVCLAGVREADRLVPLDEPPTRQAIARGVPGATPWPAACHARPRYARP